MRWLELSQEADRESVEAVSEVFHRFGYGGVSVEEPLGFSQDPEDAGVDIHSPVIVRTYLPLDVSSSNKREEIALRVRLLSMIRPLPELKERELSEEDWANTWKAFFPVHRVGRVVIKPTWLEYKPRLEEVVVELDPGMAFGTGLHPTTKRCLEVMQGLEVSGARILDVGTGSGILSIAAIKLGAFKVTALDIEPVAIQVAAANVRDNGLKKVIKVRQGTLPIRGRASFSLVIANISARVISELATYLVKALSPEGYLITAGFLDTQLAQVQPALENAGGQIVYIFSDDDWRTLLVRRAAS